MMRAYKAADSRAFGWALRNGASRRGGAETTAPGEPAGDYSTNGMSILVPARYAG